MRQKTKCKKCDREISNSNIARHLKSCNGPKKTKYPWHEWIMGDNLYQHPDGYVGNMAQVKLYIVNTYSTKKRNDGLANYRKKLQSGEVEVWNKGKSIENNPELADSLRSGGLAVKKKFANGELVPGFVTFMRSEEGRKEQSERKKKLYIEFPEKHPNRRLAGNRLKMSYPERLIFDALVEEGIEFEHNKKIGKYFPDFVIGKNIIEVDGERWHNVENDTKRDKELKQMGFDVHRFPVGNKKDLVNRVMTFIRNVG